MKISKIRAIAAGIAVCAAFAAGAGEWIGLADANYAYGPKISPAQLKGKLVLVDHWGINCGPCLRLMPELQKLHAKWSRRGLVVLGSHCQRFDKERITSACRNAGVKYPVYQSAEYSDGPQGDGMLPFMYLVSPSGKILYSGRSEPDVAKAIADAIAAMPSPGTTPLAPDVEIKYFKSVAPQLALGRNAESRLPMLKAEAKKQDTPRGKEAAAIVAAVEAARTAYAAEIESAAGTAPGKALRDLEVYLKTFPSKRGDFKELLAKLKSNKDVAAVASFGLRVEAVKARMAKAVNAPQRKSAAAEAANLSRQAARLQTSADAAVAGEANALVEELKQIAAQARENKERTK